MNRDSYLHLTFVTDVILNVTFSCTERRVMDLIFTVTWTKYYNKENALYVDRENPRFYQNSKQCRIYGRKIMSRRSLILKVRSLLTESGSRLDILYSRFAENGRSNTELLFYA